ncbi:unnamed protein product [Meloidogyne enterolobii]|uniref:Uncharacterized protein n=1 Tax=Meloidogyne enterolobii TaxID=390850 RepID=A0ACB1AAL0_MELEN
MQRNFIKLCKVCGAKENVYYHFGVCTCRACGAFFRHFLFFLKEPFRIFKSKRWKR